MCCVHWVDGSGPDESFKEWYWKNDEGDEWRRIGGRIGASAALAAGGVGAGGGGDGGAVVAAAEEEKEDLSVGPPPPAPCGMAAVHELLARIRLERYSAQFEEQGFDDLEWLLALPGREDEAAELLAVAEAVGFKPGHRDKFNFELRRAAEAQRAADRAAAL